MSEVKVNKITPRVACGTTQLGDSGDTFTIPSGATIQNLGTATGFGGTGVVSWDTASIKTTGFTAVTGTGYFCNTTGGAFTVTLPLSPAAGAVVGVADYAQTFDTNALTLGRNGSNIGGVADDAILVNEGIAVTLVYVDSTKGWIVTDSGLQSEAPGPLFVAATGGCITTCGNFKMHTFFSPGTLCVSCGGNPAGSSSVSYMVVAGGGSGGHTASGGGGAGGFREGKAASDCYTASPLNAPAGEPVSATAYSIVVGAGGAGATPAVAETPGNKGNDSGFSTITSTGGGKGGGGSGSGSGTAAGTGGSGGGAQAGGSPVNPCGGAGNSPTVSPAQGKDGGDCPTPSGAPNYGGGGGGGATTAGENGGPSGCISDGGTGAGTEINLTTMPAPSPTPSTQIGTPGPSPTARYFAGGAGGSIDACAPTQAVGGTGGGGNGGIQVGRCAGAGTINTGGGSGGMANACSTPVSGGSGIVVIRYKYQ